MHDNEFLIFTTSFVALTPRNISMITTSVHLQVRERQETVRDSRTGKESVTVTRNIGDRVRMTAWHKAQNMITAVDVVPVDGALAAAR